MEFKKGNVVRILKDTTWSLKNGYVINDTFIIDSIHSRSALPSGKRWLIGLDSLELVDRLETTDYHPSWF